MLQQQTVQAAVRHFRDQFFALAYTNPFYLTIQFGLISTIRRKFKVHCKDQIAVALPAMKKLLYALALIVVATGCVKVIAGEEKQVDISAMHRQRIGFSAHDLLSDEKYTSVRVEIQYMEGFAPDPEALYNLRAFLWKYLNKPAGIFIETKQIDVAADSILNRKDVLMLEQQNRTVYNNEKELGVYLLYTNGAYINPKILGLAYQNTSAVIFGKMIQDHSGKIGRPDRTKLETTILLHEAGHLLGLINTGSEMLSAHQDEDHTSHCSNKDCLMYYLIGTDDRFGYLVKGKIPELDAHCEADIKANGGR